MKTKNINLIFILFAITGMISCRENPVPKPYGYYRIDFPVKKYHSLPSGSPYRFDIPDYAIAVPDNDLKAEPWWINIEIPYHKAEIHISYKKINNNLFIYTEESRRLAYDHTVKASSIEEAIFLNPAKKVYGTIYYINGNAASPMQFYLTDSIRNFLRGALYVRVTPNIDSLKPVIEFLKTDVTRLIKTFEWTK